MDPATQLFRPRKRKASRLQAGSELADRYDWAAVLGLVLFLGLVYLGPLLTYRTTLDNGADSSIRQTGYLIALGLSVYAVRGNGGKWRDFILPGPVIATLLWCWASVFWAVDFDISLRRMFLTTLVVCTVFWSVKATGYDRTLAVVRGTLTVLLVANFVTVLVDPELGLHDDSPAMSLLGPMWRGLMAHKNFAGAACAVTIILFLLDNEKMPKYYRWSVLLGSAVFLYATQSKTSAGMIFVAVLAGWVFQKFSGRLRSILIVLILTLTGTFYIVGQIYAEVIKDDLLGPAAFTGRGLIWRAMLNYSADHPMLGAGFESFWNIGPSSPIYQYGTGFATMVTVGHNGYLDLLITVGYPGLILCVFSLMIWPLVQLLITPQLVARRAGLVCALLTFCIGHNFTESSLYERDALVGVVLLLVATLVQFLPVNVSRESRSRQDSQDVMRVMRRRRRSSRAH